MPETLVALPIADARTVRRRAGALVRQFRGRLLAIVLVHAAATICGLLPPALLGMVIDRITAGRELDLAAVVGMIAAALVASAVLAFAATNWAFALGEHIFSLLRLWPVRCSPSPPRTGPSPWASTSSRCCAWTFRPGCSTCRSATSRRSTRVRCCRGPPPTWTRSLRSCALASRRPWWARSRSP